MTTIILFGIASATLWFVISATSIGFGNYLREADKGDYSFDPSVLTFLLVVSLLLWLLNIYLAVKTF